MGLFGGGNSSSSTTNLTQTKNTDQRVVADAGSTVVNSGGGLVNLLDQGAVASALDLARTNSEITNKSLADLIGLTYDTGNESRQTVQLLSAQSTNAWSKLLETTDRALDRINQAQLATVNRFAGLAGDISAAGAATANAQAKTLADSFAIASGKSPNSLLILAGLALAGFAFYRYAR